MPIDPARARQRLKEFNLKALFVEELGWEHHAASHQVTVDGRSYQLNAVAHKRGFAAFICEPGHDGRIPDYATRRKIDRQVTKLAHEHLVIFVDAEKTTQIWQWLKKETGKPVACRERTYYRGQSGETIIQPLQLLVFTIDEETTIALPDVTGRVRAALDVEKVTKRFYDRFKTEHAAFLKFLKGIPDEDMQRWYVSVMLNRLMFIYFIQKKGFLDNNPNYLRDKLAESKKRGKDRFYDDFLCPLFFEGFAKKESERSAAANKLLGNVPYLNGGLFLRHQIEERYGNAIQIGDGAFDKLFAFFEQYTWHLDERPLKKDDEINPDVLGYIFEKYVNQKQMGAYYSKEDITGYISQNTVIPFLFDQARKECKIAFEESHSVWRLLQADPDRYVYDAVKRGVNLKLPHEVAAGLNDVSKRTEWNRSAPEEYALPTEIWREVVARRKRYEEVRCKLAAGEVRSINDLITYNLDIRQFTQDVIETSEGPELLRAFYKAIKSVSVLDPACGSGAFLFAALNILESLYEACLDRMEVFLDDLERSGQKHRPEKFSDFKKELEQIERHPNRKYFIYKTIIVNNLFGVDIMEEATEICKLRLFLKLVAQIERLDQIEPLPDIDFNIRAGNSLVGYVSLDDVKRVVTSKLDFEKTMDRIEEKAQEIDRLFALFREMQSDQRMESKDFAGAKQELIRRLRALEAELNRYLAGEGGMKSNDDKAVIQWCADHHPFHWFIEHYGIIHRGGFDVVLGNPPYVEVPKTMSRKVLRQNFRTALDEWSRDEDLYAFFVERGLSLLAGANGRLGMIVPLSLTFSTKRPFQLLRKRLAEERGEWWWSHFDRIPSALFGNEVRTRCTISLLSRCQIQDGWLGHTTALLRWESDHRDLLFPLISYATIKCEIASGIPKLASQMQADALTQLLKKNASLSIDLRQAIPYSQLAAAAPNFPGLSVYVGGTAYNWFPAWREIPETKTVDGKPSLPARTIGYAFLDEETANVVFALLCSSLGYWWWAVMSDGFNLKRWLVDRFPLSSASLPATGRKELASCGNNLWKKLRTHYVYKDNKGRVGNYYLPACSNDIRAIDSAIAKYVSALSDEFFEDIRSFNQSFSRADSSDDSDDLADSE